MMGKKNTPHFRLMVLLGKIGLGQKSLSIITKYFASKISIITTLLFVVIAFQTLLSLELQAQTQYISSKAASFVVDANSGQVLHDDLGTELRHPASLTKMMTLYLLFENIQSKKLTLKSLLLVSEKATWVAPSKLGLKPGSQIKVEDAIKALVVKSANDVAVSIAENISGNEVSFAKLMTKTAKKIGMEKTIFRNASGLPDRQQVTTAKDMVILALRLQKDFPDFYHFFSLKTFTYEGKTFGTHNKLLENFDGIDGIKTGYTRMSGFNLVSSFNANEKRIIGAVFGGISAEARDAHMRMLLALAIDKVSNQKQKILNWETKIDTQRENILSPKSPNSSTEKHASKIPFNSDSLIEKKDGDINSITHLLKTPPSTIDPIPNKYSIQIGVFQRLDNAEEALLIAQRHLGNLLAGHPTQTIPMNKEGKFLYIALFSDFEFDGASKTCRELERQKIDCLLIKNP